MKKIKYIQSLFTLKPTAALAIIFLLLSIFSCINKNNMIVQISIDKGSEMVSISGVIINCLKPEKNSKETEFDIYIATSYIALNDLINNNKGNYNKVKVRFPENNIIAAIGEPEECAIISTEGIQSPWSVYRVIILKVPVKVEEDKIKSFYMLKNAIYEMIAKSRKKMKEIKYNLLAEKIYENEAYTIVGIDEKNNQIEIQVKGADIGQFEIVLKDSKFVGAPFYGSGVFFEDEYLCAVIYDIISYTPPYTYKGLFIDTILDIVESRLPDIPIPTIKPEEGVIWMDPVEPQIEAGMEFYTDLYIDPGDRNIANYSITLKYNIGIDSVSSQYLKTNSTRGDCGIEPGKNSSQPIVNTSADGVLAISGSIKNIEDVNKNLNIIRIWWVGYKPITISIRVEGNLTDNDGKTISAKGGLGEDRIGIITIYEPIVTIPTPKPIEFWTPAPKPTDAPKRETGEIWLSVSPNQVIREGSGFTTDIFFEQGTEELDFYKFKLELTFS